MLVLLDAPGKGGSVGKYVWGISHIGLQSFIHNVEVEKVLETIFFYNSRAKPDLNRYVVFQILHLTNLV